MIKNIKNKLKNILDVRVKTVRNYQQTHLSYTILSQLFNGDVFIPMTYWSLSPEFILHVLNDISINKRRNIIEFGSGASTIYIAKLLKNLRMEDTIFFSVESDLEWIENLQHQLKILDLEKYVTVVHAPITRVPSAISYGNQKSWYDVDALNIILDDNQSIDLVVVDGPVGANSPFARFSAVPFLQKKLAEEFSIFLDDTTRYDEVEILEKWHKILGSKKESFKRYSVLSNFGGFSVLPFQLDS